MKLALQQMLDLFRVANEATFNEQSRHVVVDQYAESCALNPSIVFAKVGNVFQCSKK